MALIQWQSAPHPFSELDRMRQEMDRLSGFQSAGPSFSSRAYPALNLTEDADRYTVRAELPGVGAETLDVSVVDNRLVVRGERKLEAQGKEESYHRRERESGFFRRSLALPGRVDAAKVSAELKDGVLKITLPKHEETRPRKITVSAG